MRKWIFLDWKDSIIPIVLLRWSFSAPLLILKGIFVTFFLFGLRITNKFCTFVAAFCLSRLGYTLRCMELDGGSTTLRNKRHCTLCFWQLERRKFKPCSETIAEVTPTGVYIRSRSVPRVNHALNGTLLGAFYIYSSVGILLCSF